LSAGHAPLKADRRLGVKVGVRFVGVACRSGSSNTPILKLSVLVVAT
jgi:hypothetical protein